MKARTRLVLSVAALFVVYLAAYFTSVRVSYVAGPGVSAAEPIYRPWHEESIGQSFAQKLFAPAQLVDQAYLRPAKWHEK